VRRLGQTPLAARDLLIGALEAPHGKGAATVPQPAPAATAR
jgi:hypothetical protein